MSSYFDYIEVCDQLLHEFDEIFEYCDELHALIGKSTGKIIYIIGNENGYDEFHYEVPGKQVLKKIPFYRGRLRFK